MRLCSNGQSGGAAPARKTVRRFRAGFLVLSAWLLLAGLVVPVHSQDGTRLVLSGLQAENFPAIHFGLEAYDSQGNFIDNLTPADLILSEDGQPVEAANLAVVEPGIQFSVAITNSSALTSNIGGTAQIELLRAVLVDWARAQTDQGGLDFSLSTNTGLQIIRSRDAQLWTAALTDLKADPQRTDVNLFSLTTALDLASDQLVGAEMKRAILFITPPLPAGQLAGLQELTNRAQQVGVRVFVWVAVTSLQSSPPDTSALQTLAEATGGRMSLVAGSETIPNLESWLAPLRKRYEVQYLSEVKTSGDHKLGVSLANDALTEQELSFSLTLNPPNPIFLSPPAQVERAWSAPADDEDLALTPGSQSLSIVVEFPDGYTRPLTAARLYMDGALLVENTSPPFDQFTWDLTPLITSGTHSLRVEVDDALGLTGASIETPVQVVVAPRPETSLFKRISERGLIAVGAVALAGMVLGLVLLGENRLRGRRKRGDKRRMEDPVTQPVPIQQDVQASKPLGLRGKRAASEPGSWPKASPAQAVTARLIRVTEDEHTVPGSLIPLNRSETTLGSDARLAVILVEDPSVDKLHARLIHNEDCGFILTDEHSVAGTWVNYHPVAADGVILAHEDLIHLGRVMFRFELSNAPTARQIAVEPLEELE